MHWNPMNLRILHIDKNDPFISTKVLIKYFGLTNPALNTIDRLLIQNALKLIENTEWEISKVKEQETMISMLFIKNKIEHDESDKELV